MTALEEIRGQWIADRPLYGQLCEHLRSLLLRATRDIGLPCQIDARPKEVSSLLKKVLKKKHGYADIYDKAGVRVQVTYPDDLGRAEAVIAGLPVDVLKREDKALTLQPDRLGYLGVHFEVRLRAANELNGLIAEIQLQTRAQHLWAEIEHALSYKPTQAVPQDVKRRIYRLVALVELFDEVVEQVRKTLRTAPGFEEAALLEAVEGHFYALTGREFDRELSLLSLGILKETLDDNERERIAARLRDFVEARRAKLTDIYAQYADDDRNPLLFQPETILVFERLEHDPYVLKEHWVTALPEEYLDSLSTIWGVPV